MKPWLIECNSNPCLEINCSLLTRLIPNMLNNLFSLTVDIFFPPPLRKKSPNKNYMNNNTNKKEEDIWNQEGFKF